MRSAHSKLTCPPAHVAIKHPAAEICLQISETANFSGILLVSFGIRCIKCCLICAALKWKITVNWCKGAGDLMALFYEMALEELN